MIWVISIGKLVYWEIGKRIKLAQSYCAKIKQDNFRLKKAKKIDELSRLWTISKLKKHRIFIPSPILIS